MTLRCLACLERRHLTCVGTLAVEAFDDPETPPCECECAQATPDVAEGLMIW